MTKRLKQTKEEQKRRAREQRLYKTYGITSTEWLCMYARQGRVCFICKQPEEICGKLAVDHIHQKGFKMMPPEEKKKYVRGLLCYLCNTGIKGMDKTIDGKKNRQRLEGTYKYFQKFRLKGEL